MAKKATRKKTTTAKKKPASQKPVVVDVVASVCPRCGSGERAGYHCVRKQDWKGQRIEWKRTKCLACGKHRIDRIVSPL